MNNPGQFSNLEIYNPPLSSCPFCCSGNILQKYIIHAYDPGFKIDVCKDCGFLFMNPRFNDSYISNLYGKDYYTGGAEYAYYDEREAERHSGYVWNSRIRNIRKYLNRGKKNVSCGRKYTAGGNFLDVGCSFGGFLQAASGHFKPYGIDISEYAGGYSRKRFGGSVHVGSLRNHPFKEDFFDVITMIELLEHVDDPVYAVKECFRLLKDGGLLVVQTANMDGMQAKILKDKYAMFMPGHLSYFTKRNLTGLLRRAGFRDLKVFHPVEFGLLPKLLKSRAGFKSVKDYLAWVRITRYHLLSRIHFGNFAVTSSMVVYGFK